MEDSDDNELVNNDITGDFFSLQLTDDSDENVVHGNTMGGVTVEGSESNLIYDNRIRASERSDGLDTIIIGSDAGPNTWNVTPRPGENVIGGDTVAGNVYVNAEGTGFSQMCADADGDGLCDSPKEMGPNNADHAALSDPAESLAAIGDNELPTDPDGDGRYEDVDGEDGFTYADVVVLFGNLDDPAVRNYADAYDFDGAGGVTYSDVIALFWETFESPHG